MPFITITYPPNYPLTESEKKWLERREDRCSETGYYISPWDFPGKSLFGITERPNYKDAAEFEARVVAKLTESACLTCPENKPGGCPTRKIVAHGREHVETCRLKHARLAVEEEMK